MNKAISAALAGQEVGIIVDGNRRHDIVVRMPEQLRADDEQIKKLPVRVGQTRSYPAGKACGVQDAQSGRTDPAG